MRPAHTSLPTLIPDDIRRGTRLFGDDFSVEQLTAWYSQEEEAFFEHDSGNSEVDPWYAYMRFVNDELGFSPVSRGGRPIRDMLVIGPGSGIEIDPFARAHPECRLSFVEASQPFRELLARRFPGSQVIQPKVSGDLAVGDRSQDLVCAFSVLHHIANVSKVIAELGRVTRPGGFVLIREPCSSMGDWRGPRNCTPNERGISRRLMVEAAGRAGLGLDRPPVPIIFEPINRLLKRIDGFKRVSFPVLHRIDRLISSLLSLNDHYWRDSWLKKIGPSSYFYRFRKEATAGA